MYIYRVIEKERFLDGKITNKVWYGVNTFEYDQTEEYLHFFILPEHAEIFQTLKYKNNHVDSYVLQCEVPYSLIKDKFGIGMYKWYNARVKTPFLEVRIKKSDFTKQMVVGISPEVQDTWTNDAIYSRYLNRIVNDSNPNKEFPVILKLNKNGLIENAKINPEFNFLNYFPLEQIKEENLTNDYDRDIVEIVLKNKQSFISKIKKVLSKR